ncbi:MAG: glutathione S-transferase [Hyphomonadaceae bacterium]|jgi:glutathione S-transferase|nr:glutathione S-transferase [Hyphomonadaceae bacterium]MBP9235819.1 glutathione S-transferase [Hyphomonadaceae bacterium]
MAKPRLHIGDKNYSSWSMRPWLAMRVGGIAFDEVLHALPEMGGKPSFGAISPNARVPALELDGAVIAESLAICEWAAEQNPALWPKGSTDRALARSAASIMHSGFANLRSDAPMNIRRRTDAGRMTPAGLDDAAKVDELWSGWLKRSGGPYLFGDYSVADAMYAPVVMRFITYAIPRSPDAQDYIDQMLVEPNMAAWIAAAEKETRQLPRSDIA